LALLIRRRIWNLRQETGYFKTYFIGIADFKGGQNDEEKGG